MNKALHNELSSDCKACQKYHSISAVAEHFELSEKTIRRMITEGQLKAKRIGGSIRIPHAELVKIIRDY